MTGTLYCRASTRTYIFHGRACTLADLADRMSCARAYLFYSLAGTLYCRARA